MADGVAEPLLAKGGAQSRAGKAAGRGIGNNVVYGIINAVVTTSHVALANAAWRLRPRVFARSGTVAWTVL